MKTKQERSEIFKSFQTNIKRKNSYELGKKQLFELRDELLLVYDYIFTTCNFDDFVKMPLSTDKTIAYYLYHLTRIEDTTSNTLIAGKEQIFFEKHYNKLLNSPIITTGNEIERDKLVEFSTILDINQLKNYMTDVLTNTNNIIKDMSYEDSKTKVSNDRKAELVKLHTVSDNENAFWLVDYWCKKTYAGLLLMPFSRHQMLHLDGCLRIVNKIKK
ncbi:phage head-tail adapter protein [Clostridium sp. UBA1056]|uniref:phage head-tail adapter protein n=1 Tax=unclassified Clostridium TaxID=2614128 RepID=UPI003217E73B